MVVEQVIGNATGADTTITLAKNVLRRCPATVFGQVLHDKLGHRLDVLVHTPEVLALAFADRLREACANRVDHDEINFIDDAVIVLYTLVGAVRRKARILHDRTLWTEDAHVQPQGCRARAAVIGKHDGTRSFVRTLLFIGRESH